MSIFSYLKGRLSILDVIGEYTHLKKAGSYWKGQCPFHSEKTASFTVSPHKEIFYCFGCHVGGDVITFVTKVENCSPLEAIKQLADRYGLELPQDGPVIKSEEKKQYYDLCKIVALWCHEQLNVSTAGLHYLLKRGITKTSMDDFTIGYFPGGYLRIKELISFAQKHHFLPKDLIDAGILHEGKTVLYSAFEERIIFPIKDHLGRFCGFGGRIFKQHDERPKYYNSRENPFFNKGSLLFGLDRAKKSMHEQGYAFLVEGYSDCIAMAQHGYPNTIATLGTACTPEHLKTLARYIQQLYVVYDGDKAGKDAIIRLASLCWQASLEVSVVCLPAQEDPASLLAKQETIEPYIQKAKNIFSFFIETTGEGFTTKSLAEKLVITKKLVATIHTVQNPITQDLLLKQASTLLDIPFESLKNELLRLQKPTGDDEKKVEPPEHEKKPLKSDIINDSGDRKLEKNLFFAILNNIELIKNDSVKYSIEYLSPPMSTVLQKLNALKDQVPSLDFVQFFDTLDSYEKELVSKNLLEFEAPADPAIVDQLLLQFQRKNWKKIVHSVTTQLNQAKRDGDHAQEQKILQYFLELKKKLLAINIP